MKLSKEQITPYKKRDREKYQELSFVDVLELVREGAQHGDTFYVRWSESISLDKETGHSLDHSNGSAHRGLSACEIEETFASDDVLFWEKAIKQVFDTLTRYHFKGYNDCGWILAGSRRGFDSDGFSLLEASSIEVWGYVSPSDVKKWKEYCRSEDASLEDFFDLSAIQ